MIKKVIAILVFACDLSWSACSNTNLGNGVTCIDFSAIKGCSSVTNCTSNTITATTAGNLLIASVEFLTTGGVTFACSSGMTASGGTATWAEASHRAGSTFTIYVCYAANIGSGITTVKATVSGGTPGDIDVSAVELSGLATSNPLDVTNNGTGASSPFSFGPSATTASANEYAFCGIASNANGAGCVTSATGGFTLEETGGALHMGWIDKALSATATLTCSGTSNTTTEWVGALGTFQTTAAAAAAGVNKEYKLEKLEVQ